MKPPLNTKSADDFQTPPEALEPLYPYLKKEWCVWECAAGKGNLARRLKDEGHIVIASDILVDASAGIILRDFLKWSPDNFDCIITNPPYSLKQQFLERCYELGKPFALLMPLTALETMKRQKLYRDYGVEIILMPKRINFETPSGNGKSSWFATAWFTNGLKIGKELNFLTP